MRQTQVFVHDMAHPEDCTGLTSDLATGRLRAADIRAVFIKTEGNGLDNDWSRPLALRALAQHLPAPSGCGTPPMLVVSGGCEGMLTPHMTVMACTAAPLGIAAQGSAALAMGTCISEPLSAVELGREAHGEQVRHAVERACADAGIAIDDVVHVQVLSPWMGRDLLAAAPAGASLVAHDAHASKPAIRGAAALGAGIALKEVDTDAVDWTPTGPTTRLAGVRANRVAVTAGDTGGRVQVLVLGQSSAWRGPLRAASTQLADMLDLDAIASVRRSGLIAAFFKGDPPADGRVRGARTTMGADSDIHAFRHFRAAMSGVFGAALGTPRVFIGGGAEFQSAAGGGLLTTISDHTISPRHEETTA